MIKGFALITLSPILCTCNNVRTAMLFLGAYSGLFSEFALPKPGH